MENIKLLLDEKLFKIFINYSTNKNKTTPCLWSSLWMLNNRKGPFIKGVINRGGGRGGLAKRRSYLSKNDDKGGGGVKNLKKLMTSLWTAPKTNG